MANVTDSIPNLVNGVSQQPDALRLVTQSELQLNCLSSPLEGLGKRPSSRIVRRLGDYLPGQIGVGTVNRDSSERYQIFYAPSTGLRVFDLSGAEKTVATSGGAGGYLSGVASRADLRVITVADYTFIVNRKKVARAREATAPARPKEALINIKAGNYAREYTIIINGTRVAYFKTPDGSAASHAQYVDTKVIAQALIDSTVPDGVPPITVANLTGSGITAANGWTVRRYQHCIYIARNDGVDFTVAVEDGQNGTAMVAVKQSIQDFSDLPKFGPDGFVVEIAGNPNDQFGNYWVKFVKTNDADSSGVWKETLKPGAKLGLDASTLPHVLVRQADGTFLFRPGEWKDRTVGDEKTVPDPSFVGQTINSISFEAGRLTVLSGENAVCSEVNDPFNFYRATLTTILDGDPIDVANTYQEVAILQHGVSFADRMLIFSDRAQFVLSGGDMLTPKTAQLKTVAAYEASVVCRPVDAGSLVFFTYDRGDHAAFNEAAAVADNSNNIQAIEITEHVPRYIPKGVELLEASDSLKMMVAWTPETPKSLWVYKWMYSGNDKLQSAWSEWRLPHDILAFQFVDADLVVVTAEPKGTFLQRMRLSPGYREPGLELSFHMDNMLSAAQATTRAYDPATRRTTVRFPWTVPAADCAISGGSRPGLKIAVVGNLSNGYVLAGDWSAQDFYVGKAFESRYRIPRPVLRKPSQAGGMVTVTDGRLQVKRMVVNYADTVQFTVEVTPRSRSTFVTKFVAGPTSTFSRKVGEVYIDRGSVSFPAMGQSKDLDIDVVDDSPLPFHLTSASWSAQWGSKVGMG